MSPPDTEGTQGVTPGDETVTQLRHPIHHDPLENRQIAAAPPLHQEPEEQPDFWEYDSVDDEDHMFECPSCGNPIDVIQCRPSGATCPHCGMPGRVTRDGKVIRKLPQGVRRRSAGSSSGFGGEPVIALCRLFKMEQVDTRTRVLWGRKLQEIAPEHTAEQVAAAIGKMGEKFGWKDYGGNPYRRDFGENLRSVLLAKEEESSVFDAEDMALFEQLVDMGWFKDKE